MDSAPARIALCAADETIRDRIEAALVLAGREPVVVSASPEELIRDSRLSEPGLVVLACAPDGRAGEDELRRLRAGLGGAPVVMVASCSVGSAARRFGCEDAQGLVEESEIEQALPATVEAALAEQLCVPASMREALAQPVFSHRQKQVLELLFAGLTNGEIATRLFLSESTVKSHLVSAFRKLGVTSRAEAARRVLDIDPGLDRGRLPLANPRHLAGAS